MKCPKCAGDNTRVVWSRGRPEAGMRRRRECLDCDHRFSTCETVVAADAVMPIGEMLDAEARRLEGGTPASRRETKDGLKTGQPLR